MENTNRYFTGMVLAAMIVIIGGFYLLPKSIRKAAQNEIDFSHSMPRPKSALYNFFFGLDGREIERNEVNPFKETKNNTEAAGVRKDLPKIDPKKQAAAAARKPAPPQVIPAPKPAEVKVDIVNAPPGSTLESGPLPEGIVSSGAGHAAVSGAPAAAVSGGDSGTTEKETQKLSSAQWRALVLGQPTKENVMKLVSAFNNKEADANTLYMIMNDLMQSANPETQSLGLLAAQNVPSLRSFSVVSENYDKLEANVKKSADTYLLTYMQASRLSILAMALQSENTQVVTHAAQVMVAGLEQVKKGQNAGGGSRPNTGRGLVASGAGKTYTQFISILQELIKSGDSNVAGLAQNALTQIQALS